MRTSLPRFFLALLSLAPLPAAWVERDVTVGSGEWAVSGTLTLPDAKPPFPAVVLLHGSGPQDRDSSLGPNKPLRDIAHGLATRGIAALRYDKRTFQHRQRLAAALDITPRQEVFDDALAAIALLAQTPNVDPKRIFIVGHSMGATLAPRLAAMATPKLAGIALLAAAARPTPDLLLEQLAYLRTQPENQSPEALARIAEIEKAAEKLRHLSPDETGFILGAPVAYWRWWADYQPLNEAAQLSLPIFIAQGERDYQVTMTDFDLWRKALAAKPNVTLKSYPNLNHLFQPGAGRSKPSEYLTPGKVDATLLDDLAAWIQSR